MVSPEYSTKYTHVRMAGLGTNQMIRGLAFLYEGTLVLWYGRGKTIMNGRSGSVFSGS